MGPSRHNYKKFPPKKSLVISEFRVDPLYKSEAFLRENYIEKKLSVTQIAALICSARSTVVRHLEQLEIPLRDEDRQRRSGNTSFGQRWINRKAVTHKKEQETIEKARELRKQGHSYQKIADILNAMKVSTKTKKAKWHAKTVRSIILSKQD